MESESKSSQLQDGLVRLTWDRSGLDGAPRRSEPVTCGIPWPRGLLDDAAEVALSDAAGRQCPLQVRIIARWPDGSARWSLVDWLMDTDAGGYRLGLRSSVEGSDDQPVPRLAVDIAGSALVVDTGEVRFQMAAAGRFPFDRVETDGRELLDTERSGLFAIDEIDNQYQFVPQDLEVLESGPLRAAVRYSGQLVSEIADPLVDVDAVIHFFAGSAAISCDLALTNPRAAGHPGGRWALGARGSVFFRDIALVLELPGEDRAQREVTPSVLCSAEVGAALERRSLPLEIYQESSGGDNWRSSNHVNREGRVPFEMQGYRYRTGDIESRGQRASPVVMLERGETTLAAACDRFWQNFPKAIEADRSGLAVRLYPKQFGDVHELQGGERKTHTLRIAFGRSATSEAQLEWLRAPLLVHPEPDWYAQAAAIPYLLPEADDPNRRCQALVDEGIEGKSSFVAKREVIDEYGWRHFGELYADHEAVRAAAGPPLVSHYNNQYDAIAGFAAQFMRSGDSRWYHLMEELARHVVDIDLYHTDYDKSAYNRGYFWHTVHYIDAFTATHRSYPRSDGVVGGGPSSGHLYTTGLMLHYFLTGDLASRQAVIELGQYVIDADDGRKTIFRFLDRGHTGHVSLSAFDGYHGPGRSAANSLNALIDAHRLSGEQRFLDKAEHLVRRCVHPEDELETRKLDYVEGRWFYTMFLAGLGKYLDYKSELGQIDSMYAYGQAALLHYAGWAAENECLYLDKPEILEFPTETWAAQDMRKSEIFRFAAKHADGDMRRLFRDKARYFFDASVEQLERHETRALCRPLVLLQSLGYGQAHFDRHPDERAPQPTQSWEELGPPREFVPQKARAKRNFVWLSITGMIGLAALAFLKWLL